MKLNPKDSVALEKLIRRELGLSERAGVKFENRISDRFPVKADIQIKDKNETYIVEIKHTASLDALSHLLLYQRLIGKTAKTVIAAKVISDTIHEAAKEIDAEVIQLPHDIVVSQSNVKPRGKITSDKAWKVISHIIREGPCSIRSASKEENVSYAWTHRTVKSLLARGIVKQEGYEVEIADINDLLNAIAWERPLKDLQIDEISTSFESTHELAKTITRSLEDWNQKVVFGVYTAATLQFGYGVRRDAVYCYVSSKDTAEVLRDNYQDAKLKRVVKIIVLQSDRDVFTNAEIIDGVKITPRRQTILDVAGLGYSGRDLLNNMVEQYGTDSG